MPMTRAERGGAGATDGAQCCAERAVRRAGSAAAACRGLGCRARPAGGSGGALRRRACLRDHLRAGQHAQALPPHPLLPAPAARLRVGTRALCMHAHVPGRLVAAKTYYFGVGGGTRQFEDVARAHGLQCQARLCCAATRLTRQRSCFARRTVSAAKSCAWGSQPEAGSFRARRHKPRIFAAVRHMAHARARHPARPGQRADPPHSRRWARAWPRRGLPWIAAVLATAAPRGVCVPPSPPRQRPLVAMFQLYDSLHIWLAVRLARSE